MSSVAAIQRGEEILKFDRIFGRNPIIRIEPENPVPSCVFDGNIARCGKAVLPFRFNDTGSQLLGQFTSAIG